MCSDCAPGSLWRLFKPLNNEIPPTVLAALLSPKELFRLGIEQTNMERGTDVEKSQAEERAT